MMNRSTGRAIAPLEHLKQSIGDILATPIGSRVMRRAYGSQVPLLIDQPDNPITQLRVTSAAAAALMRWEPRLALTTIRVRRNPETPGRAELVIEGDFLSPAAARQRAIKLTVALGNVQ
ncbi:MAG: GPW/gp25 family protein [Desulfovibrionaceae bacterium]|nr:GPW/gp25 family protein [Desulfovibrionaceae bacterium]